MSIHKWNEQMTLFDGCHSSLEDANKMKYYKTDKCKVPHWKTSNTEHITVPSNMRSFLFWTKKHRKWAQMEEHEWQHKMKWQRRRCRRMTAKLKKIQICKTKSENTDVFGSNFKNRLVRFMWIFFSFICCHLSIVCIIWMSIDLIRIDLAFVLFFFVFKPKIKLSIVFEFIERIIWVLLILIYFV